MEKQYKPSIDKATALDFAIRDGQKKFGYGDICVYAKGIIPGVGFFGGFQIKNVENVQENLDKIGEILGITIEQ